jgi:23S rRNA pseudouridine955/2504/2580 synthase/23S rRNA pseudouridine1911/1915/1917 synthase
MKHPLKTVQVLFEDDALIAVAKPAGIPSVHDGNRPKDPDLASLLEPAYAKLWPVHRLDRDTSGVILFARTEEAHRALSAQFEDRDVHKTYHAILAGMPTWDERTADAPLLPDGDRRHRTLVDAGNGKPARTHFRVLQRLKRFALVEASPETGRTHQIRAHAAVLGVPIAVDALYGDGKPIYLSQFKRNYRVNADEEIPLIGRLALHALRIQFTHPVTGEALEVEAPYPKDFSATVNQLGKL